MDNKEILEIDRDFVNEIIELVHQDLSNEQLIEKLTEYHPFDIAQAMIQIEPNVQSKLFDSLPVELLAQVFERFEDSDQIELIKQIPTQLAIKIIDQMDSDDAVDLLQYLEDVDEDYNLVNLLSPKKRSELKKLWSYQDNEIGSAMSLSFIELTKTMTVKEAMKKVTQVAGTTEYISILYVVEKHQLVGYLRLKDLIIARANQTIEDIMENRVIFAHPHDNKESVATLFQNYGVSSLPIVDENEHMMGLITYDDLMDIITEYKSEDYAKFAALTNANFDFQTESVIASVKNRLPWLSILLALSMITSVILSLFEDSFSGSSGAKILAAQLAVYLPLILDMSGNTGTQSLAVMIRYLTTKQNKITPKQIKRYMMREFATGLSEGILISVFVFLMIMTTSALKTGEWFGFTAIMTASVTSGAILIVLVISTVLGALIPLIMNKFHIDPAVASGPFITTISDIVSLTLYYSISLWLLLPYYL